MRLRHDETVVVVIAPAAWSVVVERSPGTARRVLRFETLDELDRWRASGGHAKRGTVRAELIEALQLAGMNPATLSPRLRSLIEKTTHRHTIPRVKELQRYCSSARAFFRLWASEVPERPSRVLLRARVLLAVHLIEHHEPALQACRKAGFRSVPEFARQAHLGGATCARVAEGCSRRRRRLAAD
jgi:hypothetical protein